MTRRYVIFLIGAVVLLVAIIVWLIYISVSNTEESTTPIPTWSATTTEYTTTSTEFTKTTTTKASTTNETTTSSIITLSTSVSESTLSSETTRITTPTTRFNTSTSVSKPKSTTKIVTNTTMTATTTSFTMPKVTTSTKQPSTTECESTSSNTTIKIPTTTPIVTTEDSTRSTHSDIVNCSKESNFDYVVRDAETKTACILTSMSIRINLQYVMENYQTNRTTLIVPRSAKTTGQCGEKIDNMTLSWKESVKTDNDNKENVIVFYYGRDARFFLDFISIDVHLDSQNFPSAKQKRISANTTVKHLQLFSTLVKDGVFVCKVNTIINIGNQIDVVISDVRLIAFNQCSRNCRRTENNCVTDVTSVLIGAVVIGIDLLLILVVSFLTWRKKNIRFYAI